MMNEKDAACFTSSKKECTYFIFQIGFKYWFPWRKVQLTAEVLTHQQSVDEKIVLSKFWFVEEKECQPTKFLRQKIYFVKKNHQQNLHGGHFSATIFFEKIFVGKKNFGEIFFDLIKKCLLKNIFWRFFCYIKR